MMFGFWRTPSRTEVALEGIDVSMRAITDELLRIRIQSSTMSQNMLQINKTLARIEARMPVTPEQQAALERIVAQLKKNNDDTESALKGVTPAAVAAPPTET